jgi:hypothetical protein
MGDIPLDDNCSTNIGNSADIGHEDTREIGLDGTLSSSIQRKLL